MKRLSVSLILIGMIFHLSVAQQQQEKTFSNPLWDGADPWMVKQGDQYIYCYSSHNSIMVSISRKMTERGEPKAIWKAPATGWNRACIWAPEIHFLKGRWYVYYAAGESGPPFIHQRSGVLRSKSSDLFSEYEDMGELATGDQPGDVGSSVWAIDLTVFEHKKKLYAIWSGWLKNERTDATPQHLYISEMKNPYTLKGPRVKLSSPVENWETGGPLNLNEGAEVLKHGKKLFVVYSCRESWLVEYRLGLLELVNPRGNLLDTANWIKRGPVFQGNETVHGVGHCSFVKSPDNREDWIIYHSKKSIKPGWDRNVRMQRFDWNQDGSPNFGQPVATGIALPLPSGEGRN